jgi:predicted MFS family arabinose efflux permease
MNRITAVLTLGAVGIITTEFGIVGLLPDIASQFGTSIDHAGLLISLFALAVAVSGPLVTLVISRWDRKKAVQFPLLIFIFSNILSVFSGSFTLLLVARVLPAFFLTAYFATALVIAVESVDKRFAIRAVTTIYGGLSIATVIGIPLISYLAGLFTWRESFWLPAVINATALAGITFVVPAMPGGDGLSYGSQLRILKKKALWINLVAVCAMAAGSFAVYSYFADYLERIFGMEEEEISIMLMVFGIAGVIGNWAAGIALGKSLYKAILVYLLSMMVIYIFLRYAGTGFLLHATLIAVWGFFHMSGFVISQAWVNSAAPEAPALANSLVVSIANSGIALGAALGGTIIAHSGIAEIPWGGMAAYAVALLAVILAKAIPRK